MPTAQSISIFSISMVIESYQQRVFHESLLHLGVHKTHCFPHLASLLVDNRKKLPLILHSQQPLLLYCIIKSFKFFIFSTKQLANTAPSTFSAFWEQELLQVVYPNELILFRSPLTMVLDLGLSFMDQGACTNPT